VIGGAAIQAGSAGDAVRGAVAGLIGATRDREPAVRIAATRGLVALIGAKGSSTVVDLPGLIDALVAMLGDRDDQVRLAALHGLASCGPLSRSGPPAPIVSTLEDRSGRNRAMAIRALAAFPGGLDPWLAPLLRRIDDGDPEVGRACGQVFARDRPPAFSAEAIPRLVAALGSRSRGARYHAARALAPHASDPRAAVAIPALLALLREPIDIDPVRRPAFYWNDMNQDPAQQAASVVGKPAPGTRSAGEVIAALTEIVRAGHRHQRETAASALGDIGPAAEPAVPALIRVLRDDLADEAGSNYYHGASAARALARIAPGTRSADEALAALIEVLDVGSVRRSDLLDAAFETLPAFGAGAARALPRLHEMRKDAPPRLKAAADKAVMAIEAADSRERTPDQGD
jgi:HEAT repeat protein